MSPDIGYIVGLVGALAAIYFGYKSMNHESTADLNQTIEQESKRASELAVISSKLEEIQKKLDEIKTNQSKAEDKYYSMSQEISNIKTQISCIETRLSTLEGKGEDL